MNILLVNLTKMVGIAVVRQDKLIQRIIEVLSAEK